ncbi:MAG: T9SS type A sorting domain-containing protein [Crocinitomicaceae bacterium]|nr:T9SS type A sorting domain-containing protein [Crocinitomicaceae bacterium]
MIKKLKNSFSLGISNEGLPGGRSIVLSYFFILISMGVFGQISNVDCVTVPVPDILHYKFDETGTSVTNHASTPPSGTSTASIIGSITQGGTGQVDGAIIGTGAASSAEYLNTNWTTDLGTASWTISFWSSGMTPNTNSNQVNYVFGDNTANSFRCFTNGIAGNNDWLLRGDSLNEVYLPGGASTTPTLNTFVYDSVASEIRAYLNGTLVNTVTQSGLNITGIGPFKVMGYTNTSSNALGVTAGGMIDEFRVYGRDLSQAEIMALFNLSSTPDILYYKFDETGTSVTNYASYPPSGTSTATIVGGITQGGTGQINGALTGTGDPSLTDYLNTNWTTDLGTASWTISFWSSGMTANTGSNDANYVFGDNTASTFRCFTNGDAGSDNWLLRGNGLNEVSLPGGATATPTLNTFVYDSVTSEIRAYLNGALVNVVAQSGLNITGVGPFKVMGYSSNASNAGVTAGGMLDEFRVYGRALSQAEIMAFIDDEVTACDSYTWNGTNYTTTGLYTWVGTNAAGCDSASTLNLTINNSSTSSSSATACGTYTWNGTTYTTSGIYTWTGTNAAGCDSIATLNLTISGSMPVPDRLYYKFDETGTSVTNYASSPPSGTSTATIVGGITQGVTPHMDGALTGTGDPSLTDYLNTNWATDLGTASWTISFWSSGMTATGSGDVNYVFGDNDASSFRCFTNGPAGDDNWLLRGTGLNQVSLPGGATETPTLNTFVYDSVASEIRAYLNGTLVNVVAQSGLDITGVGPFKVMGYSSNAANAGVTAGGMLDEFRVYGRALSQAEIMTFLTDEVAACGNYTWNGTTYTTTGVYTWIGTGVNGCDSTATLNLTINNSSTSSSNVTACDSYIWNGVTYTTSGVYTWDGTNAGGCDSTATLNLTINNSSTSSSSVTACDSYTWNGTTYTTSGVYTWNGTSAGGCDSTATLNLTINTVNASISVSGLTITADAQGATYQWIDCENNNAVIPAETGQSFTATTNGDYAVIVTENQCTDTSECVAITTVGISESTLDMKFSIYPNPTTGEVTLSFTEKQQDCIVEIVDVHGKLVSIEKYEQIEELPIKLGVESGIYFISITLNDKVVTERILKY